MTHLVFRLPDAKHGGRPASHRTRKKNNFLCIASLLVTFTEETRICRFARCSLKVRGIEHVTTIFRSYGPIGEIRSLAPMEGC